MVGVLLFESYLIRKYSVCFASSCTQPKSGSAAQEGSSAGARRRCIVKGYGLDHETLTPGFMLFSASASPAGAASPACSLSPLRCRLAGGFDFFGAVLFGFNLSFGFDDEVGALICAVGLVCSHTEQP